MIWMSVNSLVKRNKRIAVKIAEVFEKGSAQATSVLITKSGEKIPFLLEGHEFVDGEKIYFMGVGLNISKQMKLENDLVRAERANQEHLEEKIIIND